MSDERMKILGSGGEFILVKALRSKPSEWSLWSYLLVGSIFAIPSVLGLLGFNIPSLEEVIGKSNGDGSRSATVSLVEAVAKTQEAVHELTVEHERSKKIFVDRMNDVDLKIESLQRDVRELRAELLRK